jgi:hypothetical protein
MTSTYVRICEQNIQLAALGSQKVPDFHRNKIISCGFPVKNSTPQMVLAGANL